MGLCFLHVSHCFRSCMTDASPTFHTYMALTCLHVMPAHRKWRCHLLRYVCLLLRPTKIKNNCFSLFLSCSQAADRPGGAPYSRSGEGEPGAEAEGWDQYSQTGSPTTEGAAWGHREWTESPKVRWRRARTGTCEVINMIYTQSL